MIVIQRITTSSELQELEGDWNRVLEESASNTITLTYEWMATWWEVFGQGRQLNILVAREGGEVIGIAPLLKREVQHYGVLAYRRLEFLASGEDAADEICSEYLDFIVRRGREEEVVEAFFDHLYGADSWDEILLTDMSGESVNLPIIERLHKTCFGKREVLRDQSAIYIPLPETWEQCLNHLSRGLKKKISRERRVFEAHGGELRVIGSEEGFEEGFEMLVELHQARWTGRGEPGVFSSEKFTRFHRLLASRLLRKGWLTMFILMLDGKPVSALYSFIYNDRLSYYQSGFVEARGRLTSPGILVQSYAIEHAIRLGLSEYDFMKGEVGSYKSRWSGNTRSIIQLRLAQSRPKEAVYTTTSKLIESLRHIKKALLMATTCFCPSAAWEALIVEGLLAELLLNL